jgi:hypothetical protein
MKDIDRRWIIGVSVVVAGLIVFAVGFVFGRSVSGSELAIEGDAIVSEGTTSTLSASPVGDPTSATIPPQGVPAGSIPEYGAVEERDGLVTALAEAGMAGGARDAILVTADEVCFHLAQLEAQGRSPAFAVRVVWNESLAELRSTDLAAFAAVFAAAPSFLCPDSVGYANDVAYWLGY